MRHRPRRRLLASPCRPIKAGLAPRRSILRGLPEVAHKLQRREIAPPRSDPEKDEIGPTRCVPHDPQMRLQQRGVMVRRPNTAGTCAACNRQTRGQFTRRAFITRRVSADRDDCQIGKISAIYGRHEILDGPATAPAVRRGAATHHPLAGATKLPDDDCSCHSDQSEDQDYNQDYDN
jgi:hypothetical protein